MPLVILGKGQFSMTFTTSDFLFVSVCVISWIVFAGREQRDPRNHTNGHEMRFRNDPNENEKWKMENDVLVLNPG